MTDKTLYLPDATRALNAAGVMATYPQLWRAVVEGRIPAERIKRRWMIRKDDLPKIADTFPIA